MNYLINTIKIIILLEFFRFQLLIGCFMQAFLTDHQILCGSVIGREESLRKQITLFLAFYYFQRDRLFQDWKSMIEYCQHC